MPASTALDSFISLIDLGVKALLYSKFRTVMSLSSADSDVFIYPDGVAMRIAYERRGDDKLEFINFWRTGLRYNWDRNNSVIARRGISVAYTDSNQDRATTVKAVPAIIDYNVSFWSRSRDTLNVVSETYLFWQQNNPNLSINYNDSIPLELDLHFGDIVDNSTVEQEFSRGQYFSYSAPLQVEGWVFSGIEVGIIQSIIVNIYDNNRGDTTFTFGEEGDSNSGEYIGTLPELASDIIE